MANIHRARCDTANLRADARLAQAVPAVAQRLGFEPSLWGWQRRCGDLRLELLALPGGYRLVRAGDTTKAAGAHC